MIFYTLSIPVCLLILISLNLWYVFGCRGQWAIKAIITPLVLLSSVIIWGSLGYLMGWPTQQDLPEKYQLHWIIIEEPSDKDEGAIYLLVNDISIKKNRDIRVGSYVANTKEPRLYKAPYSRAAHKQAQQFQKALREGKSLFLSRKKGRQKGGSGDNKGEGGKSGEGGDGKAKGEGLGGEGGHQEEPFGYIMPPSRLPNKGRQ